MEAPVVAIAASADGAGPRFDGVAEYVRALGGHTPVRKVLIANNGIAAVKAIRSIRRWAYDTFGNEREVRCCVVPLPSLLRQKAHASRCLARQFPASADRPSPSRFLNPT